MIANEELKEFVKKRDLNKVALITAFNAQLGSYIWMFKPQNPSTTEDK